jgi:hypothetical protein
MSEIRINTQECPDFVEFEEYIDLQKVVVRDNRDYKEFENAKWFTEAINYISDMDYYGTVEDYWGDYDYDWSKLSHEQVMEIIKAYDNCRNSDDSDFILKVVRILHPETKFDLATIRGYCQGDWNNCIYVDDGTVDLNYVESIYFGKMAEIYVQDNEDDYVDFILDDELWELNNKGTLKEELCKRYSLNPDETHVYVSDGIIRQTRWKQVG